MDAQFERRLTEAVRDLSGEGDPPATLERLVEIAPEFFPHCHHAGVSIVERDGIRTPAATSEELRQLDEAQYTLGQGPCFEAIRSTPTVVVEDLAHDPRWPIWGRAMAEQLEIRSSLSFRLFTRSDHSWGALNVYSRLPRAFTDEDVVHGQTIAAMAAVVLARSINDEQLVRALETRTHIGQATGILMERYDLDADRAFEVLRRISSQTNTKLRDLGHPGRSGARRRDAGRGRRLTPRPLERGGALPPAATLGA
jgi:GAF domain-containing protein